MTETRIRWEDNGYGGFEGYAGTLNALLFDLWQSPGGHVVIPAGEWILTGHLPAPLGRDQPHGPDLDDIKAEAERWLAEFVSSLGAIFPDEPAKKTPTPDGDFIYGAFVSPWVDDETGDHARRVYPFQVTKRTPEFIYYTGRHGLRRRIDRKAFERDGLISTRHYHEHDRHLFATFEDAEQYIAPSDPAKEAGQ